MIDYKTKMIISYKLSKFNDTQLGLDTIIQTNINNCIIHTDHRSQYSSIDFIKYVENNNVIQSMIRVGNSLDNREIEHWFCTLKNELTHHIDTTKITFNHLSDLIDDYIEYYNKERIQEKLGWLTPNEYKTKTLNSETVQI